MISKERLEELIEQGATIWGVYDYTYSYDKPNKKVEYINLDMFYHYYKDIEEFIMRQGDYCNLFETKEEAEWYREFGCIERTERLELPTWEEFSKWDKSIKFYNNSTKYSMYVFVKNKNTKNCRIIIYADNGEQDWLVFEQPLTQENYILACRKAKELFLGEKK